VPFHVRFPLGVGLFAGLFLFSVHVAVLLFPPSPMGPLYSFLIVVLRSSARVPLPFPPLGPPLLPKTSALRSKKTLLSPRLHPHLLRDLIAFLACFASSLSTSLVDFALKL